MIRLANDSDFEIIEKIGTSNYSNNYYEGAESFFSFFSTYFLNFIEIYISYEF